jgi:hypothetical protein
MFSTGGVLTKNQMVQNRTQFYGGNGTGRDTYIFLNNGGFCPATEATKIEDLGKQTSYKYARIFTNHKKEMTILFCYPAFHFLKIY